MPRRQLGLRRETGRSLSQVVSAGDPASSAFGVALFRCLLFLQLHVTLVISVSGACRCHNTLATATESATAAAAENQRHVVAPGPSRLIHSALR